jgi:hypothetical protein
MRIWFSVKHSTQRKLVGGNAVYAARYALSGVFLFLVKGFLVLSFLLLNLLSVTKFCMAAYPLWMHNL